MDKSEALRLADELERDKWHVPAVVMQAAADELRRLHAENERLTAQRDALLEALKNIERSTYDAGTAALARAAIAKTEGNT